MFPYFMIFGKIITTYWLMSLIGAFAAGIFTCVQVKRIGEDDNDAIVVMLFSAIGVILGGHLLYGITQIRQLPLLLTADSFGQFIGYAQQIFGGSVFYGGLFGGLIAAMITVNAKKLKKPLYRDLMAFTIPLFHAFARTGCFLSGCCYGIECEWGFTTHTNDLVPDINGVSRFPVQLLEAALNLLLFGVLFYLFKRTRNGGFWKTRLLPLYGIGYATIRFFDEFLRGDAIRGFVGSLSTSQFISILVWIASAVWLWISVMRERRSVPAS